MRFNLGWNYFLIQTREEIWMSAKRGQPAVDTRTEDGRKGSLPSVEPEGLLWILFTPSWWAGILDDPGLQLLFMSFIPKIKWVINNTWSSRLLCFIYFLISVALVYNSLCWISSNWLDILLLLRYSPSHGFFSLNGAPVTSIDRWGLNRLQR